MLDLWCEDYSCSGPAELEKSDQPEHALLSSLYCSAADGAPADAAEISTYNPSSMSETRNLLSTVCLFICLKNIFDP